MATVVAIVEDDTDQRENYSDVLTAHGYEVRAYADRPSAEAAFDQELPDLALLDIMLGEDMDGGFDLCMILLAKNILDRGNTPLEIYNFHVSGDLGFWNCFLRFLQEQARRPKTHLCSFGGRRPMQERREPARGGGLARAGHPYQASKVPL